MPAAENDESTNNAAGSPATSQSETKPTGAFEIYARGVRTALRNNATAYGFSITITVSYGLITGPRSMVTASQTAAFGAGAAVGFVLVGAIFAALSSRGSLPESTQTMVISGVIDVLSVASAIAVAFGLSQLTGFWIWPLTGAAAVITYLLIGGLDVLLARSAAKRTTLER